MELYKKDSETIIIKSYQSSLIDEDMGGNLKGRLAILMGIVIAIADVYWAYTRSYDMLWVALGIIIFIADIVWLYIDWGMMK